MRETLGIIFYMGSLDKKWIKYFQIERKYYKKKFGLSKTSNEIAWQTNKN
jgi:hypothetical protein